MPVHKQFWYWFLSDVSGSITHVFEIVREGQTGVEDTNPAPGVPGAAALCDPLDVEAARVAEMVEQAQSRCEGMLFTATPTQDLDAVITCQHLANQAFALMPRTLTALTNRAGSNEREWVPDEIALALNVSSGTGWSLQHLAVQACELPGLVEAVEADLLSDRHLRAVVRAVCDPELDLTLEHRQAAIAITLARYHGQSPHELAKELSKLILQIDLTAQRRQDRADTARGVRSWARPNGQASVMLTGPTPQIGAVLAALTRQDHLTEHKPGDTRSQDNRSFDLAIALLTGGTQATSGSEATIVSVKYRV